MSACIDTDTAAFYRGPSYVGWFHVATALPNVFEGHYVPHDPALSIVIVSNCTLDMGEHLGEMLDTVANVKPQLLKGERTQPSVFKYAHSETVIHSMMLSPVGEDDVINRYPGRSVVQLIWADENHNFPWDDAWVYPNDIQALLVPRQTTLH